MSDAPDDPPASDPERRGSLIPFAALFYGVVIAAALFWMQWRGRWDRLIELGRGDWHPAAQVGTGLGLALLVVGLSRVLTPRVRLLRVLEAELRQLLGPLSEADALFLSLASGIAEELFFRGAMQDQVDLFTTAIAFALLHTGRRAHFAVWTFFSLLMGLVLGLLVQAGAGLLTVTLAHATINYLNLRRICGSEESVTP